MFAVIGSDKNATFVWKFLGWTEEYNALEVCPTYDGAEIVDVDGGIAGARGQEAVQLWQSAVVVMPPQCVDDFVVLLDAAQQLQTGGLIHIDAPAAESTWSVRQTHEKKERKDHEF